MVDQSNAALGRILNRMREKVLGLRYVVTFHAEEEMSDDGLTVFDVEAAIVTGRIIACQKDHATAEWKYVVEGRALAGDDVAVVVKFGPTGKLVIITVYRE